MNPVQDRVPPVGAGRAPADSRRVSDATSLAESPEPEKPERFLFIDALRGVAALGVLFHHLLHNVMEGTLFRVMPGWGLAACEWGKYGVQIFFVLSGFVIAHSLRHGPMDGRAAWRFILRRQLRLDPPCWCALFFALAIHAVSLHFTGLPTLPMPGVGTVILNVLYLQNIMDVRPILVVAWTLCVEIQFYLVFMAILALAARQRGGVGARAVAAGLVVATGCLSLLVVFLGDFSGSFIQYWFFFAAGALCYWAVRGWMDRRLFYGFAAAFALVILLPGFGLRPVDTRVTLVPALAVGLGTAVLIYLVGRAGRLTDLWTNPLIQYFGRISYSLYLMHYTVVMIILETGRRLTGDNRLALLWFAVAALASVAAGHALYLTVERPLLRFAHRIWR